MLSPIYRADDEVGREWILEGLCTDPDLVPSDFFFAPETSPRAAEAASLCWQCPVREKCLEWANTARIRHGIWGGQPYSIRYAAKFDFYLLALTNPYETEDPSNRFHVSNLTEVQDDDS